MRILWTLVPGLVLLAGAFGLADSRMHSEQLNGTIDCGSLLSGVPHVVYPDFVVGGPVSSDYPGVVHRGTEAPSLACASQRDFRAAEAAGLAALGVVAIGGAAWVWWRDAPLRAAAGSQKAVSAGGPPEAQP
jgi:hypothetical protein